MKSSLRLGLEWYAVGIRLVVLSVLRGRVSAAFDIM